MAIEITFPEYLQQLKNALIAGGKAKRHFLLISCIDLRYPSFIHGTLSEFDLDAATGYGYFEERYDQVALAGGGLAGVIDFPPHKKPEWAETVIQHVALSIMLHDIAAVVILDHRDCGAYRSFGLLPSKPTKKEHESDAEFQARLDQYHAKELEVHEKQMLRMKEAILHTYPDAGLIVDCFLLPERPERPEGKSQKDFQKQLQKMKILRVQ